MTRKTLWVAGDVDNGGIELNGSDILGGVTIVSPTNVPPLDTDDATYIQNTATGPLDYMVRIDTLSSWSATDPIELHLRWSMETEFHDGEVGEAFLFLQYTHPTDASGDYYVGQFSHTWNVPVPLLGTYDGTIHDTVIPMVTRPPGSGTGYGVSGTTLVDVLTMLASADAWFTVNVLHVADAGFVNGRIYEAYLLVGTQAFRVPARRLYPGTDGDTRVYPVRPSPQSSTRFGPAAPL